MKILLSPRLITLGLAAVAVLALPSRAPAAFSGGDSIFIDLGLAASTGGPTASPDVNGTYWNNYATTVTTGITFPISSVTPLSNMVTTTNGATSVGFGITAATGNPGGAGSDKGGLTAPSSALLGKFAIPTATEDSMFIFGNANVTVSITFTFSGLNPTSTYNLAMFGNRSAADVRTTVYSVTDTNGLHSVSLQTSGPGAGGSFSGGTGNDRNIASLTGLVPNGSGNLSLTISSNNASAASNFAYLNIVSITAVPEPGTYAAFVSALLVGLVIIRRRGSA